MSQYNLIDKRSEGERALANHEGIRDALKMLAAMHIATGASTMDSDIGLTDIHTNEQRTFHIAIKIEETTKK